MRLGALIGLATGLLGAQTPRALPWEQLPFPPWQPLERQPLPAPALTEASSGPLKVRLSKDGTLRVVEGKGQQRLLMGLPGRPVKAWRDGGLPLEPPFGEWAFPEETPLLKGLNGQAWEQADLRPKLSGLLWVLVDGEKHLAVLHPATGRAVFLPLPAGETRSVEFQPGRLLVWREGYPPAFSLPWVALLPTFLQLGAHRARPAQGGVFTPF